MRIVILSLAMVIGSMALVTVPVTTAQAAEQKVEAKKEDTPHASFAFTCI